MANVFFASAEVSPPPPHRRPSRLTPYTHAKRTPLHSRLTTQIMPMINTPADAAAFVNSCLYPSPTTPDGTRSFGPMRAMVQTTDYFREANELVVKLAMIETKEGLNNVEEIAAVRHLDALFIGPLDLSLALVSEEASRRSLAPPHSPPNPPLRLTR